MASGHPPAETDRRRRWTTWSLSALVVVALAIGGVLWWTSRPSTNGGDSSATVLDTKPVPKERLQQLEAALSSPDPAVQAAAVDPAIFARLQAAGQALLPTGSTLKIDTDSSHIIGQTASVNASVTGPQSGDFTLLLALESGVWVVYAAVPA